MKKLGIILIGILVALVILSFAKDMVIKVSVEKGVELVTGLRLGIRSLSVGIIRTLVDIKDMRLYNPKGFKDPLMMDMKEIYVDYDLPAIIEGKYHLYEMRVNLEEFVVIKNEKGELNLDSLKVVQEGKGEKRPTKEEKAKMPEVQIDKLHLRLGKAVYKDYSRGGEPRVEEYNIDLDESYQDIDDPQALVSIILVKVMTKTAIGRLTNFDLSSVENVASDALKTAEKVTAEATKVTGQALEKTKEVTGGAVEKTTEVFKDTTKGIGEVLSSPFGARKEEN